MLSNIFSRPKSDLRPVFIVGTGRCGTHLMYELFNMLNISKANHILDLDGDSFYRYFKWNNIHVDLAGFFSVREKYIKDDEQKVYVESNPYLSFHIPELVQQYNARFIFLVRNAEDVVRSHISKGWYENDYVIEKPSLPLGYQYGMKTNHFFGRVVPRGDEFEKWQSLTRVGKISWMWERVNMWIQEDFEKLQDDDKYFLKVEDMDFQHFKNLLKHFNIKTSISQEQFLEIITKRPGKSPEIKKMQIDWSTLEKEEFLNETRKGRAFFGY